MAFWKESDQLLEDTMEMNEDAVAKEMEEIHTRYASAIEYNNENSLSCVLSIAYLSAMKYYFKPVREFPTGKGFADFVFLPKREYVQEYPALLVELKWNKDVQTAISQIKEKNYPQTISEYTGEIMLVGINYDKKTKEHQCRIEKINQR